MKDEHDLLVDTVDTADTVDIEGCKGAWQWPQVFRCQRFLLRFPGLEAAGAEVEVDSSFGSSWSSGRTSFRT